MKTFAAALAAQLVGGAALLLLATRRWQTIITVRPRPFGNDVLQVTGRTVDGAITALALVALAGAVAVISTKGIGRRIVGGLVALAGVALVWRVIGAMSAMSRSRARDLVRANHPQVDGVPYVVTHPTWAALSLMAAVLVIAAGLLTAWRGGQWAGLSRRYDRDRVDPEQARARADATMWTALESGEDPTAGDPQDRS